MRNSVSVQKEHSTIIPVTCRPGGHRNKIFLGSCHRKNCCFSVPEWELTLTHSMVAVNLRRDKSGQETNLCSQERKVLEAPLVGHVISHNLSF